MIWKLVSDPLFSSKLCAMLLHSLWQVALFALAAHAARRLWRRRSIERDYVLHVLALVASLIAMPITFAAMHTVAPSGAPSATTTEPALPMPAGLSVDPPHNSSSAQPGGASSSDASATFLSTFGLMPIHTNEPTTWVQLASWAASLYAIGVVVMLARLGVGVWRTNRLVRRGIALHDGPLVKFVRTLTANWSLRNAPLLLRLEEMIVPQVVGILRPSILLPASALSGLSSSELELIVIHELAHLRRHDLWVNLLQRLAETALFFNPVAWHLSRQIGVLREFCCDELACRADIPGRTASRTEYALALLRVAELAIPAARFPSSQDTCGLAGLAASGRSPSQLRQRVASLLGAPLCEPVRMSAAGMFVVVALALVLLFGLSSWHSAASSQEAATGLLETSDQVETAGQLSEFAPKPVERQKEPDAAQPIHGTNYVIVPWANTELQKSLWETPLNAYVLIDGNSLYTEEQVFDSQALAWEQLARDLEPFSDREKGAIMFHVFNYSARVAGTELVGWTLEGFGRRRAGFQKSYVSQTYASRGDFQRMIDTLSKKREGLEEGAEPRTGNDLVRVYAVRTLASSIKTDGADCVVEIVPLLDKDTGRALPQEIREAILELVPKVQLDKKQKLLFKFRHKRPAADATVDWFHETGAKELGRMLDFEETSASGSPH
jgi:beta-lactamase regulating signal transducer with metallopeptidase domain